MRLRKLLLVLFVCSLGSCSKESIENIEIAKAENAPEVENALMAVVNDHRISLGQNPLEFSAVAYEYANDHNDYMISKGSISHDNFSARASRIASEVNAQLVAENLAKDYDSALEAFESWLASSTHKTTMEGDFTHSAVSVKKNSAGDYYFTHLFFKK